MTNNNNAIPIMLISRYKVSSSMKKPLIFLIVSIINNRMSDYLNILVQSLNEFRDTSCFIKQLILIIVPLINYYSNLFEE